MSSHWQANKGAKMKLRLNKIRTNLCEALYQSDSQRIEILSSIREHLRSWLAYKGIEVKRDYEGCASNYIKPFDCVVTQICKLGGFEQLKEYEQLNSLKSMLYELEIYLPIWEKMGLSKKRKISDMSPDEVWQNLHTFWNGLDAIPAANKIRRLRRMLEEMVKYLVICGPIWLEKGIDDGEE